MNACVVTSHNAGLFSLINKVMVCAGIYDHVHVDFTKGPCLYGEPGQNVWDCLFHPTEHPSGAFDEIADYPDWSITAANAGKTYESGEEWRFRYHKLWNRFRVRETLLSEVELVTSSWTQDTIGILVRCNGHSREQLSDRSQPLDEYARAFERIRREGSIMHVMAGDWMTLKWFQARFPVSFSCGIRRTETRDEDQLLHGQQTVEDARKCMVEVMTLARCRALIHPVSNMATSALYQNPFMESVYLR